MPEDLSDVQKRALELLTKSAKAFHFGNIRGWLEAYGLPSWEVPPHDPKRANGRAALRALLGLGEGGLMERRIRVDVGGTAKRWPLRYCIMGASPASLYPWLRDRPPIVARDALVTAMVEELTEAEALEAWHTVAGGFGYGFGRDHEPEMFDLALDVSRGHGRQGVEVLSEAVAKAKRAPRPSEVTADQLTTFCLASLLAERGEPWPTARLAALVRLLDGGTRPEAVRRVLERLPDADLERVLLEARCGHAVTDGELVLYGGWAYFDLCPTPAVMRKVIAAVADWVRVERTQRDLGIRPPVHPHARAVEVLAQGGDASVELLTEALKQKKLPKHADVYRDALRALGVAPPKPASKKPAARKPKAKKPASKRSAKQ
jgi:hypothetical protein